jgi:hypothetical protein
MTAIEQTVDQMAEAYAAGAVARMNAAIFGK